MSLWLDRMSGQCYSHWALLTSATIHPEVTQQEEALEWVPAPDALVPCCAPGHCSPCIPHTAVPARTPQSRESEASMNDSLLPGKTRRRPSPKGMILRQAGRAHRPPILQGTDGPKGEKGDSAPESLQESLVRGHWVPGLPPGLRQKST